MDESVDSVANNALNRLVDPEWVWPVTHEESVGLEPESAGAGASPRPEEKETRRG